MFRKLIGALVGLAMMGMAGTANAVVLIIDGGTGQLTGATGVPVGDMTFDVEFLDGSCGDLFTGCNDTTDFDFATPGDALAAAQALLDTVFIGAFDTANSAAFGALVFGCGARLSGCLTFIPFAPLDSIRFLTAFALNACDEVDGTLGTCTGTDGVFSTVFFVAPDLSGSVCCNYARFTKVVDAPEPSTFWLMVVGLLALAFPLRRKKSLGLAEV